LLRLCNPNAKPLSADTIHDDIIKLFENEKKKIQEILQVLFISCLINIDIDIK
jgi:hypothetical protein